MAAAEREHLVKLRAEDVQGERHPSLAAVGKSPLMAPWGGVLNEQQVQDVVAYVRSLAEPAYSCP